MIDATLTLPLYINLKNKAAVFFEMRLPSIPAIFSYRAQRGLLISFPQTPSEHHEVFDRFAHCHGWDGKILNHSFPCACCPVSPVWLILVMDPRDCCAGQENLTDGCRHVPGGCAIVFSQISEHIYSQRL